HQLIDKVPPQYDPDGAATSVRVLIFLYERNGEAARAALDACEHDELVDMTGSLVPRSFLMVRSTARWAISRRRGRHLIPLATRPNGSCVTIPTMAFCTESFV